MSNITPEKENRREFCVGCGHSIGMHFNDVIGVARCLVVEFGTGYRTHHCACADFQLPKSVPTAALPPRSCGCVGGQFCKECY